MAPGLKYGFFAAAGMIACLLLAYVTGLHSKYLAAGQIMDWAADIVLVVALWRLLYDRLYTPNRYWLPLWQGLLHGLFASVVAAMCFYMAYSLYLQFVNPEFPDLLLEYRVAQMRADLIPEEEIRAVARNFRWSVSPIGLPISVGLYYIAIGFVASPILTLWLNWRHKQRPIAR